MDELYLEGFISIEAALASPYRTVEAVYLREKRGKRHQWRGNKLRKTAVSQHIPIHQVDDAFFETHASGKSHGGMLAKVGARRFLTLAELVAGEKRPFIVMLDGVEDPFNFGQAVRSLYAAGVTGLVLPPRNWTTATDVVTRASAGTTELMPMAIADNTEKAAKFFQKQGLKIACTTDSGATDLYQADLTQPMFLLIGGEKRGITRSFLSQAELKLRIPYKRPFAYALGVTASVAILSFERMRQLTPIISPDS